MISSLSKTENATTMRSFVFLTALLAVTGLGEMQGKLILDENNICLMTLKPPQNKTLLYKQSSSNRRIGGMARVDHDSFIFSDEALGSVKDTLIKQFDLASGEVKTLGKGFGPIAYLPESGLLLFYRWLPDWEEYYSSMTTPEIWLVAADPKNIDVFRKVAPATRDFYKSSIVQTSTDEIVFYGEGERLWISNLSDLRLRPTGIKNCWPEVWREQTKELLCSDRGTRERFLINLVTGEKKEIPKLKGALGFIDFKRADGFIHVPRSDAVIYAKEQGKANVIYIYSFEKDEEKRLQGTCGGSLRGIWMP